jgi:hypothetical protein
MLPVAMNSSGLLLFPGYAVGHNDSSTNPPKNHLWDSAKRQWADLPRSGSQAIEIEGGPTLTATDRAGGFIDINDTGTVSAFGGSNQYASLSPTVDGHKIRTQLAMIWEKSGTSSTYGSPKYFIYHPAHPLHPKPPNTSNDYYWNYCEVELDIIFYGGLPYHWNRTRTPGGRIGIDGSMNLFASGAGSGPVWLLRDGTSSSRLLDQTIKRLKGPSEPYYSQVNTFHTFPGAILDKNHALFVETLRDATASDVWLKDGEDVINIASVTPRLGNYAIHETDMIFAPSNQANNAERLWIAAGNKILLEKRAGGAGAGRWHYPPSMAEGAHRLNARGEAITLGKPAAIAPAAPTAPIPPKLWRNGKYTDLNELASKPDTVTITQAIDLTSNGIILAQATENDVAKTGILLPVELRVRQNAGHTGPHGSGAMYSTPRPDNGQPWGELFSLWENEESYLTIGGALGALVDAGSVPAGFVKWSSAEVAPATNQKEYRVIWNTTGQKEVKLEIGSQEFIVRFNIPNTGTWRLHDDALKNHVGLDNWALCGALGLKARNNVQLLSGQDPGTGDTKQDALRHSTWNLLSAAAIGKPKTIVITTGNEHSGRLDQAAFSSNSTMDLFNNDRGGTEGAALFQPGGTQVDTLAAIKHMRLIYEAGNLRAWTPYENNVNTHHHIIRKSDQKTIFGP